MPRCEKKPNEICNASFGNNLWNKQRGCNVYIYIFSRARYIRMCPEIARVSHLHATGPLGSSLCLLLTIFSIYLSLSVFWCCGFCSLSLSLSRSRSFAPIYIPLSRLPILSRFISLFGLHRLSRTPANYYIYFSTYTLLPYFFLSTIYAFSSTFFPAAFFIASTCNATSPIPFRLRL